MGALALAAVAAYPGPSSQTAKKGQAEKAALADQRRAALSGNFLENKGQWDRRALFHARSQNLDYWVTRDGVVLDYHHSTLKGKDILRKGHVIKMSFAKAGGTPSLRGLNKKPVKTDFITRSNPKGIHASTFGEVRVDGIYKGVSARHYFDAKRPRYDLMVAPGADASQINLDFSGTKGLQIDAKGDLVMATSYGEIKHADLFVYQVDGGKRKRVDAKFRLVDSDTVAFSLGRYDRSKELVIDPLVYGSYFGGDANHDAINSVVSEPDGAIFMTGWTESTIFPAIQGGYQTSQPGGRSAFITRFRGDAYGVDYNSYLGGSGYDEGLFVASDSTGRNIWVLGVTESFDFPVIGNPVQPAKKTNRDLFFFRFQRLQGGVLSPVYGSYYAPQSGEILDMPKGFAIAPDNEMVFAVRTSGPFTGSGKAFGTQTGDDLAVVKLSSTSRWLRWVNYYASSSTADLTGMAMDRSGNIFVAGTGFGNLQSRGTVYQGGQLARGTDAYVAKLNPLGTTNYLALIGGSEDDFGYDVAADSEGNAYVLGFSRSFDFPRTIGTFGQRMRDTVTVSKLNAAGTLMLASTSLLTNDNLIRQDRPEIVIPRGIAVDGRGNVAVTGVIQSIPQFTDPNGDPNQEPPNPDVPIAHIAGSVQTTSDALKSTYTWTNNSTVDNISTFDGWLNVLDGNLVSLMYGSYIGGDLDETINRPYVDQIGDLWVFGGIDTSLAYRVPARPPTGGGTLPNPKEVLANSGFPNGFITPLAFKASPERSLSGVPGFLPEQREYARRWVPFQFGKFYFPQFVGSLTRSDGYVLRFRFGLPVISNLLIDKTVVPGGLGATVSGTVVLDTPAPLEGVTVKLTLSDPAVASFNGSPNPGEISMIIPSGATQANFAITTKPVTQAVNVGLVANFAGNIRSTQFTVVPWLQQLSIAPSGVQGGYKSVGRITLAAPAPTGGVPVQVASSDTSMVEFPTTTVTVPAGQTSVNFDVPTKPVSTRSTVTVTASLLGVSKVATLILEPLDIRLLSMSINPKNLEAGQTAIGTITLDKGAPDSGLQVRLSSSDTTVAFINEPGSTVTFQPGFTTATFRVTAAARASAGTATITASVLGQNLSDTVSVSPTEFSVELNPSSIVGGNGATVTGRVVLGNGALAGTGGQTFTLNSSDPAAQVPATVTVAEGENSASFTIAVSSVSSPRTANITATIGGRTRGANLIIRSVGLASFTITPTTVRSGTPARAVVTLDSPAPAGGVVVQLGPSDMSTYFGVFPTGLTVTVPAGQTSAEFSLVPRRFARPINVTVTASAGGVTKQVVVSIIR